MRWKVENFGMKSQTGDKNVEIPIQLPDMEIPQTCRSQLLIASFTALLHVVALPEYPPFPDSQQQNGRPRF